MYSPTLSRHDQDISFFIKYFTQRQQIMHSYLVRCTLGRCMFYTMQLYVYLRYNADMMFGDDDAVFGR